MGLRAGLDRIRVFFNRVLEDCCTYTTDLCRSSSMQCTVAINLHTITRLIFIIWPMWSLPVEFHLRVDL